MIKSYLKILLEKILSFNKSHIITYMKLICFLHKHQKCPSHLIKLQNTCKLRKVLKIDHDLIHTYTLLMEPFEYNCLTLGDPLLDLFLLDRVLLGLRGLDSFVELGEHGGELGRNRGDCLLEDLGDVRYWRVMLSPWQS